MKAPVAVPVPRNAAMAASPRGGASPGPSAKALQVGGHRREGVGLVHHHRDQQTHGRVSSSTDAHDGPVRCQGTVTEVPKLAACLHLFCALQWLTNSGRKVWLQSYVRGLRGDVRTYF